MDSESIFRWTFFLLLIVCVHKKRTGSPGRWLCSRFRRPRRRRRRDRPRFPRPIRRLRRRLHWRPVPGRRVRASRAVPGSVGARLAGTRRRPGNHGPSRRRQDQLDPIRISHLQLIDLCNDVGDRRWSADRRQVPQDGERHGGDRRWTFRLNSTRRQQPFHKTTNRRHSAGETGKHLNIRTRTAGRYKSADVIERPLNTSCRSDVTAIGRFRQINEQVLMTSSIPVPFFVFIIDFFSMKIVKSYVQLQGHRRHNWMVYNIIRISRKPPVWWNHFFFRFLISWSAR